MVDGETGAVGSAAQQPVVKGWRRGYASVTVRLLSTVGPTVMVMGWRDAGVNYRSVQVALLFENTVYTLINTPSLFNIPWSYKKRKAQIIVL